MASKVHNKASYVARIYDASHEDLSVPWGEFWVLYLLDNGDISLFRRPNFFVLVRPPLYSCLSCSIVNGPLATIVYGSYIYDVQSALLWDPKCTPIQSHHTYVNRDVR